MLTPEAAEAAFTEQAEALAQGGVDVIWIETMSALEEARAATIAAQKTGLPVMATMTFDTAGRSMMGIKPADYKDFAAEVGLQGFGANCGIGPAELIDSLSHFDALNQPSFVIAKGNCGIPAYMDGEIHYHGTPELMAEYALIARDLGARIIGGCCGTSAEHIQAMRAALDATPKGNPPTAEDIANRLGIAWKDLADAPSSDASEERARRRRRRPKAR
jgi:5-methyltetrahydrofolate--homocysteine methyltransferase